MHNLVGFEVPLLDLSLFTLGDAASRKQFANDLRDSLVQHGFVRITNHRISEDMVDKLFAWSNDFFRLPMEVKQKIAHKPGPSPQRGWSCIGAENTAKLFKAVRGEGSEVPDSKEHFDVGSLAGSNYPNKWPSEAKLPGFRPFFENIYEELRRVSLDLLGALEVGLDLPAGAFTDKCQQPANELRINHYPATTKSQSSSDADRAWPHTDLGVITCLFQDDVGGLEIEDRRHKGRFLPIRPGRRNEMVVNISETMERWTNGKIPAGVHRVKLPQHLADEMARGKEVVVPERFSIPYFVKADQHVSVGPLPQFVDGSSLYPDMTALDFHVQRIASAYSVPVATA